MDLPVAAGAVIGGKYRVDRVLGRGGMGVVVEATQLDLNRRVAIKFLHLERGTVSPSLLARFEREARAAAMLHGVHVARVVDVGRLTEQQPFIVLEFLEGRDLDGLLEASGPLRVEEAVGYLLQACEGLAEAHAAGIIHRDLKPANLFLTRRPDGRPLVKILDFGISKITEDADGLTATQSSMGSPLYMCPEALESVKNVTPRADVWALGTILYELLAGEPAFAGESTAQVYRKILAGEPEPLSFRRPDVPAELEAIVARCLEKEPDRRFRTVADLACALAPFGGPGADAAASAAVRMIRASPLAHPELPQPFDSLPPGAAATIRDPLVRAVVSRGEPRGAAPTAIASPGASPGPPRGAGAPTVPTEAAVAPGAPSRGAAATQQSSPAAPSRGASRVVPASSGAGGTEPTSRAPRGLHLAIGAAALVVVVTSVAALVGREPEVAPADEIGRPSVPIAAPLPSPAATHVETVAAAADAAVARTPAATPPAPRPTVVPAPASSEAPQSPAPVAPRVRARAVETPPPRPAEPPASDEDLLVHRK